MYLRFGPPKKTDFKVQYLFLTFCTRLLSARVGIERRAINETQDFFWWRFCRASCNRLWLKAA